MADGAQARTQPRASSTVPLSMYGNVRDFGRMSLDAFAALGWARVSLLRTVDELGFASGARPADAAVRNRQMLAAWKRYGTTVCRGLGRAGSEEAGGAGAGAGAGTGTGTGKETGTGTGTGDADGDGHVALADCLAHFILRLAFCRTAELRAWFASVETALFKWRFQNTMLSADRAAFVGRQDILGFLQVIEQEFVE